MEEMISTNIPQIDPKILKLALKQHEKNLLNQTIEPNTLEHEPINNSNQG